MEFVVRQQAMLGATLDMRRCAIGRGGIACKEREGDGVTPIGIWQMRRVLYRPDMVSLPQTKLPIHPIACDDGWCDASEDPLYNRPVKLPYPASHEAMWREDRLYDIVVVLGFNDSPVIAGKGSAIFLHVAREDYGFTEGCVALALTDLLEVLLVATTKSIVQYRALTRLCQRAAISGDDRGQADEPQAHSSVHRRAFRREHGYTGCG